MIELKISNADIKALTKHIEQQTADIMETIGIKTYNAITAQGNFPYWSGSYISSWKISTGTSSPSDKSYNPPDQRTRDKYPVPPNVYDIGEVKYGESVFISNYAPHAAMVESEGTPTHPDGGWHTGTAAINEVVGSYKGK